MKLLRYERKMAIDQMTSCVVFPHLRSPVCEVLSPNATEALMSGVGFFWESWARRGQSDLWQTCDPGVEDPSCTLEVVERGT